jgi:hypothetical protein
MSTSGASSMTWRLATRQPRARPGSC